MLRSILSVVVGFVAWTVLWLSTNAVVVALSPDSVHEDGSIDSAGLLLITLALSVVFSILAGWITTLVGRGSGMKHALALGIVLLAVGIFVQVQYWDSTPLWYHLTFLGLLVPASLLGARLRRERSPG